MYMCESKCVRQGGGEECWSLFTSKIQHHISNRVDYFEK